VLRTARAYSTKPLPSPLISLFSLNSHSAASLIFLVDMYYILMLMLLSFSFEKHWTIGAYFIAHC
jgi:hypothetical protein